MPKSNYYPNTAHVSAGIEAHPYVKRKCEDCGMEQLIAEKKLHDVTEEETVFGFVKERLEVVESEKCMRCGGRLTSP